MDKQARHNLYIEIKKKLKRIKQELSKYSDRDLENLNNLLRRVIEGRLVSGNIYWHEKRGVIYFEVISDGTNGPGWIKRLQKKGFRLSEDVKRVLMSPNFKPTNNVIYKIAILPGVLLKSSELVTRKIRKIAQRRCLKTPNLEVVCLIRDTLTGKKIEKFGLKAIVVFHNPIIGSDGKPFLLGITSGFGDNLLCEYYGGSNVRWSDYYSFAFVASEELLK